MKIARFEIFRKNLDADKSALSNVKEVQLYRFFEGEWFDANSTIISDQGLIRRLSVSIKRKLFSRTASSKFVYFPITQLDAVAVMEFRSAPQRNTSTRIFKAIQDCLRRSQHQYEAKYNDLTGLQNRSSFVETMNEIIEKKAHLIPIDDQPQLDELSKASAVVLFALDIDNFKQTNDNFGHQYGDVVLNCFARRIEAAAEELVVLSSKPISLKCFHPSGEEFYILATGEIGLDKEQDIAEYFRKKISETPLPSDDEWKKCVSLEAQDILTLPPLPARTITASIGGASIRYIESGTESKKIISTLVNQADAAVYKAKQCGRNQAIRFADILQKYGRVLEHHAETGIVTIDIGRKVNVSAGQEFHVFHPDFSGDVGFIFSDGRTQKRLGTYPRIPSGMIEILDVQSEIAFARVRETWHGSKFPPASRLEAVPVGSIGHLLGGEFSEPDANRVPQGVASIEGRIKMCAESEEPYILRVFKFSNLNSFVEARGTGSANRALARLFEGLREKFPQGSIFSQLSSDEIAAFYSGTLANIDEICSDVIRPIKSNFSFPAEITVGGFDADKKMYALKQDLNVLHGLKFARYASLQQYSEDSDNITLFSVEVAESILSRIRQEGDYGRVKKDFETLKALGINTATMQNQFALAHISEGNNEEAIAALKIAVDMDKTDGILMANLAFAYYWNKEINRAGDCFTRALELRKNLDLPEVYALPLAISLFSNFERDKDAAHKSAILGAVAKALDNSGQLSPTQKIELIRIRRALADA